MILVLVLTAWASLVNVAGQITSEPASTRRADECLLAINGRDIREFEDSDNALRLDVDDTVQIDGLSSEPTSVTRVAVDLPVGPSIPVLTLRHRSAQRFTETLRIADISDVGVGWYHIEIRSGPCEGAFWVRVYGRSPLTTVIGVGAAVLVAAGVALVVVAVLRARRGRSSLWWGAGAGLLVGVGLCLLAQQFSVVAFTPTALALFLGGGAVGGTGAAAAGSTTGGGSVAATIPQSAPPPPAPAPPAPAPPRQRPQRQRRTTAGRSCIAAASLGTSSTLGIARTAAQSFWRVCLLRNRVTTKLLPIPRVAPTRGSNATTPSWPSPPSISPSDCRRSRSAG